MKNNFRKFSTGLMSLSAFIVPTLLNASVSNTSNKSILSQSDLNKQIKQPNIIFILCDDMGYGDLACYGQKYIKTPNIDRLAKQGMLFTQAYAGAPVSAPSRSTLMTGQHTGHCYVRGNKECWRNAPKIQYAENEDYSISGQEPYDPNHIILPEIMKENGYTTGMFGKWAGGYEGSCSVPETRGIDEFFGYNCQYQAHLYYPNFLNRYSKSKGDKKTIRIILEDNVKHPMFGEDYSKRTQYSADLIHNAAMEWIDSQDGSQPFYGFLTYTLPHAELRQPNDTILSYYKDRFREDKTWGGVERTRYNAVEHTHANFAAMITRLDAYVGDIMNLLDKKGLADDTILIFSSDNGPHEAGGADPEFFGRDGKLRGIKRQCYEGGIRIPFIVRWPGHIKPSSVNDHQLAFYDVMPTFCDIAGDSSFPEKYINKNLKGDGFDGISFLPTLLGNDEEQQVHDHLYWEFAETNQIAVRQGDWKLVVKKGKPFLYNLAKDIHEDNNIANKYPDKLKELISIIYEEHVESPIFKVKLPNAK